MDDVSFCSDSDCLVVNALSSTLRGVSKPDEIGNRLTLSARCLQVLYEGFRHVQNSSCIKLSHTHREERVFSSLTHLQDVMQNAKELMIFDSGETLQGHVNCAEFSSITSLEVKCLPLYQLYGLSKVAPNLTSVTCVGCITRIQELFEQCGADTFRASNVLWSKLKEVHLAYNNLQSLDSSLNLVSKVTHFDVSHNNLNSTDDFLMVLHNLINLNLSYNSLRTFPEISRSANRHLTHLNLRNNLITSLKGLNHLFCLQYLDVSNNILTASSTLNNLKSLLMLYCLVLAGNPVGFHPSYRYIIIGCLHPAVIPQITFDGQRLTRKEKKQFDRLQAANVDASSRPTPDFLESMDDSVSSNCDSVSDSQRKILRKCRPRLVEITAQDNSWQETNGFQKIENSTEFCDSNVIHSVPSSTTSCTEQDGERFDSELRSSKNRASRGSSSCSSSRRMKSKLQRITSPRIDSLSKDLEADGVQNNISITGNRLCFVGGENDDDANRLDSEGAENVAGYSHANAFKELTGKDSSTVRDDLNKDSCETDGPAITIELSVNSADRSMTSSTIDESNSLNVGSKLFAGDVILSASAVAVASSENETSNTVTNGSCRALTEAIEETSEAASQASDLVVASSASIQVGKNPTSTDHVDDFSASYQVPCRQITDSSQRLPVSRSYSCTTVKERPGTRNKMLEDDLYRSVGDCDINAVAWQHTITECNSMDTDSVGAEEDITLDSLIDNGFDGDFLVYLIDGSRYRNVDDKCIVSVINNWLYVRTAKEVIERLDLHRLLAVQKMADQLSDYIMKKDSKVTFDSSFPGPVVRLLFDSFNQDKRERLFSMKDQNRGKQFARLLKSFIKTKKSPKMQCLRCDLHFDESDGKIVNADLSSSDIRGTLNLQAGHNSIIHCPKCDSHFVIEVLERTSSSFSAKKSQTMVGMDQGQSTGDKISSKHKKRRRNQRHGTHDASMAAQMNSESLSSSFSFSFMQRKNTIEQSILSNRALKFVVEGKAIESAPDDISAVDAVQFYIDPSEE